MISCFIILFTFLNNIIRLCVGLKIHIIFIDANNIKSNCFARIINV